MKKQALKRDIITAFFGISVSLQPLAVADTFIPYGIPTIDGTISPGEWPQQSHIRMARFYGFDQFSDLWLQWDEHNLYLSGIMQDATFFEDGNGGSTQLWENWHDDSLEVYIHPNLSAPAQMDEKSRLISFTATGRFQSINRGKWALETGNHQVTGLETLANTTAKITRFLNTEIDQHWVCPVEQPDAPAPLNSVRVQFAHQQNFNQDWRIEMAIPWQLLGTRIGLKVVGAGCALGEGVFPDNLAVQDGTGIKMNFLRTNDDDGGAQNPHFSGTMIDGLGNITPDGVMLDDWVVYQGDRYKPQQWETFILSDQRVADSGPQFHNTQLHLQPYADDGYRLSLTFSAPQRADNSILKAAKYEIRYLKGRHSIDAQSWPGMQLFEQAQQPATPGTNETIELLGLQPGAEYTIAVRALDEKGNISEQILTASATTSVADEPFISISPTGRNLVLSNGQPFVPTGETALMPTPPLRNLYDERLCDEHSPDFLKNPPALFELATPQPCGFGMLNKFGIPINGIWRNFHTEDIFYRCFYTDGSQQIIARLTLSDDPFDNCSHEDVAQGRSMRQDITNPQALTGPQEAEDYFSLLKENNINVLSIFIEALDLDASPIFFQNAENNINLAVIRYLDRMVALARQYDVYLILRLYDTFYYKDDRYNRGDNRKWTDTHWFRDFGKNTPENFFDSELDTSHKQRISSIINLYKNEPHVLGWDLINEIDNKARFNSASLQARRRWLDSMLSHAQLINPNQLIFFSFLTWDPKDDQVYRAAIGETLNGNLISEAHLIGMDADTAYRIPGADMAMPHAYYAHRSNPWAPSKADYTPEDEMARGITYGFYQIRDGRPILDGESSPNTHLYRKKFGDNGYTEVQDDLSFLRSTWLHFVAGGAGAFLRWPADLDPDNGDGTHQINATKRNYLKVFQQWVGTLSWNGHLTSVNHRKVNATTLMSIRNDGNTALIYLKNPNNIAINSLDLQDLPSGTAELSMIKPDSGEVLFEGTVTLNSNRDFDLPITISDSDTVLLLQNLNQPTAKINGCQTTLDQHLNIAMPCLVYQGKAYQTSIRFLSSETQLTWQWHGDLNSTSCPINPQICVMVDDNLDLNFRNIAIDGKRYKATLSYHPDDNSQFRWRYQQHNAE